MKYWIMLNGTQLGPMEPHEALNSGMTPQTYVWAEGMADWIPASQVPELAAMFNAGPGYQQPYGAPQQPYQQQPAYPQQPYGAPQQPYQQPYGVPQPGSACPPTYMVWAILSTIFCCLPLGIVSIVFASQVNGLWQQGQLDAAQKKSKSALNWAIASAVTALVGTIIYIIFIFAVGASAFADL